MWHLVPEKNKIGEPKIILDKIDQKNRPYVWRQKTYWIQLLEAIVGLPGNIYNICLLVRQQLVAVTDGKSHYDLLKDREERRVPHWFSNIDETYNPQKDQRSLKSLALTSTYVYCAALRAP